MSCKTDKDEKTTPKNESKPSAVKERKLPQWEIKVKEGKDVDES